MPISRSIFAAGRGNSWTPPAAPSGDLGYGWQLDETNTGLARLGIDGNALDAYTGPSVIPAGTTISLKKITLSEIICYQGNITIDRCLIKPTAASDRAGLIYGYDPDVGSGQLGNVTVQDCDIDGTDISGSITLYRECAFRGAGTLLRNRIWSMGSGIAYFGTGAVTSGLIEHNYIYSLRGGGTPPDDSHNEAGTVRSFTGTSLVWRNNKLICLTGHDSGALFLQTYAGDINNVSVEGNYFETASWCLYLEQSYGNTYSNMSAVNNRFKQSGFGPIAEVGGPGFAVLSQNYFYNASNPPTYAGSSV